MFMRTKRLFLRPPFPEDWREMFRGINDAGVVRMLARAPWPYREQDARDYCLQESDPMDVRMVITLPGAEGAPIIGAIGIDCSDDVPTVGYWIARGHRRKGYASEALEGMLQIARTLGVCRVEASHFIDNPASGRVLTKGGFVETGEIRPSHALGRGGQMVLERRYALQLCGEAPDAGAASIAQDNRKPA